MINFLEFINDNTGIKFNSLYSKEKNITVTISDGYTGLNLWKDKFTIYPNQSYFFSGNIYSAERKFEIQQKPFDLPLPLLIDFSPKNSFWFFSVRNERGETKLSK